MDLTRKLNWEEEVVDWVGTGVDLIGDRVNINKMYYMKFKNLYRILFSNHFIKCEVILLNVVVFGI